MVYQSPYSHNEKFPDIYHSHHDDETGLITIISENRVHLRLHLLTKRIVRFQYSEYGVFENDFSYAIDPEFKKEVPAYKIVEKEEELQIALPDFFICIEKKYLRVNIYNHDGSPILEDEKGYHWEESDEIGGNIVQMTKKAQEGEAYFGLGDKPTHLNLKGKRLMNWGTDEYGFEVHKDPLYKNIPFYYGLHHDRAYGIFFDNSFKTYFDYSSERQTVTSFWAMGGQMNYYFINGPELLDVSREYMNLTGKPDMPPLWSLGYQQSKWSYQPESQVQEIVSTLREKEIPCDVIHIDIDYMDGFRCFTWDKEKFPDPKRMVAELHEKGMKTIVIIDPGIKIDFDYPVFKEAFEKKYFCRRADGPFIKGKVWPGDCYFPDFTNPEVREWWAGLYEELVGDVKVDGVWNDMNEPALFEVHSKTFPLDVRHDYDGHPCSHRKAHNVYGMQMARATHEGQKRFSGNNRVLTITRSCFSGIQRFSGAWTGDNIASWGHIWAATVQCLRASISGLSYIGADVGGFIMQPSGEMYIRFLQLGVFHPFFRTHSSGDHGDQEPWSFGPEYTDYARETINLRYRLLPYLYTAFYQCSTEGLPFLRPLSFYDQTDSHAIQNNEIFLAGDHILTGAVMSPGAHGRTVYFPKGRWYNFWNALRYEGQKETWVDVPLDKTMVIVKAGAVLPLFPVQQYVDELEFDSIEIRCYLPEEYTESTWYEDDGKTLNYQSGEYCLHSFTSVVEENVWTIAHKTEGAFAGSKKEYRLSLIGLNRVIAKIEVDGQPTDMKYKEILVSSGFKEVKISFKA